MAWNFIICFISAAAISCMPLKANAYATQTVYGFLDFTTTIGDTIMVFSPNSAPDLSFENNVEVSENTIKTEPLVTGSQKDISPTKHSSYNVAPQIKLTLEPKLLANSSSLFIKVSTSSPSKSPRSSKPPVSFFESNFNSPEYDFLSRQPIEFAEESYRLISHKIPSDDALEASYTKGQHENRKKKSHITGIIVKSTQSEKHIPSAQRSFQKNYNSPIRPSSSLRILKTSSPTHTPNSLNPHIVNRLRKNYQNKSVSNGIVEAQTKAPSAQNTPSKQGRSRNKSKRRNKNSNKFNVNSDANSRRQIRSKIHASSIETDISTSLLMLKLNRTLGRWQYKTSPKPRVLIRKVLTESTTTKAEPTISTKGNSSSNSEISHKYLENEDLESSGSHNGPILNNMNPESKLMALAETLNVEISTPDDFKNIYYEIATMKTPYIFQVGLLKKTRFITVTSTIEKTIEVQPTLPVNNKPLIENILTSFLDIEQDPTESNITLLRPIHLNSEIETPSLETIVETLSTTLKKLKTQVLPFIRDELNETFYTTLVQTYDITTIIAATKTVSPFEDHFEASRNFKDFSVVLDEAGSEINMELEFGDTDNFEVLGGDKQLIASSELLAKIEDKEASPHTYLHEAQKQKPAPINIFNSIPKLSTVITTSRTYIAPETLWESHVVPIVNGIATAFRTLSKSIGTVEKTRYKVETTTVLLPNIPSPQISINPFLLPQDFQTITSPIIQQTTIQQTNSKVLKLTFGAKTAYTTIYSTLDVPTTFTTFVTTAIPVQHSAAFPGYFAPTFHPFQFLG